VDEEWTPGLNVQARDRVSRIGQQRPVLITRIVANHPLDERIAELNAMKQALIDASVDGAEEMTEADHPEPSEENTDGEQGRTAHA
jgi:SNF2 family DNA or RNA helicase